MSERQAPLDLVYARALTVLRAGFKLTAALLLVGITVAVARDEALRTEVDPFSEILPALRDGHSWGIVDLAILAIMITPLATVVTVAATFRQLGETRFARYSLAVMGILAASIALSLLR